MAILKKRTSSKQIPAAKALTRAPLSSVINSVGSNPNISGGGSNSITSAGGSKPSLTTGTTSTPSITNNSSSTTRPSLTTSTTGAPRQTLTSVNRPSSSNSTTNRVVNALTGAALGAGTKLLIDKITGKPTVVKTGSGGTGTTGGTGGAKTPAGGTNTPASGTKNPTGGANVPAGGTKTPAGSVVKPPAGGATPPAVTPKSPAGGAKPPVTSVTKPADGGSTTNPYQGTPADPSLELPAGAIDNGDGTYTTVFDDGSSMTYSMKDDSVLYSTDTNGKISVTGGASDTTVATDDTSTDETTAGSTDTDETDDTTVTDNTDAEYFQDDDGNIYILNADGGYDLYRAAEVEDDFFEEPAVEEEQYYNDGNGNIYRVGDDGEYELYRAAEVPEDIFEEDEDIFNGNNIDYDVDDSDYYDYTTEEEFPYEEYYDFKRGGLTVLMKNGGVPKFANGNLVNEDGMVTDYRYSDEDGSLYMPLGTNEFGENYVPLLGNQGYMRSNAVSASNSLSDGEEMMETSGTDFSPAAGVQYFDDGSYIQTFEDGSTMTFDYDGNLVGTTEGYQTTRDDEGNYVVTDGYGNVTVYDPSGSVIPLGGGRVNQTPITSAGGGNRTPTVGNVLGPTGNTGSNNIGSDFLNTITGALGTTAGAAGAGALIASLLGSDFGGGTGQQNQGLDMSKVGVINPRTTNFGIGPTNFVGYQDYGTSGGDYTPNEELLRNLNAPGFNPVREGDYGYEEPAEEVPAMASGGLSSMATPVASYYTFGQPADILANLGMRAQPPMNPPEMMPQIGQQKPPQQMQQQGLPQQMPPQMAQQVPQGMPQQGMMPQQQGMPPPMRKGGLPHASNVPMVEGRMDFRKGAAVHGAGDGQSDDIPAMLADGEYVIDAETVAQIGNGSTKAGAKALDKFREGIRAHKRSAPLNKIPPKTKALTSYLKGAK